ncbi:hypothetical protein GCM10010252_19670 [Streptomyces aureoverticillatus]|nr:hypothetical protein GCM10010252_19670 [Streptomyces aureoverticillatus]
MPAAYTLSADSNDELLGQLRAGARVGQGQGPLVHIAGRGEACPSCGPAYGPLTMPDPNPNRTPAKAA